MYHANEELCIFVHSHTSSGNYDGTSEGMLNRILQQPQDVLGELRRQQLAQGRVGENTMAPANEEARLQANIQRKRRLQCEYTTLMPM